MKNCVDLYCCLPRSTLILSALRMVSVAIQEDRFATGVRDRLVNSEGVTEMHSFCRSLQIGQ